MSKGLLLLLYFFVALAATAQQKIALSLLGGPAVGSIRGNEIAKQYTTSITGYTAGVSVGLPLSSNLSAKAGFQFNRKGYRFNNKVILADNYGVPVANGRSWTHLDYITLPLQVQTGFGKSRRFVVMAGGFAGYLLSAKNWLQGDFYPKQATDLTKNLTRFDAGLCGSVGYDFWVRKKTRLSVLVQDQLGLANISRVGVFNNGTIKTNAVCFLLQAQLPL